LHCDQILHEHYAIETIKKSIPFNFLGLVTVRWQVQKLQKFEQHYNNYNDFENLAARGNTLTTATNLLTM
jgi:hypothetical protein